MKLKILLTIALIFSLIIISEIIASGINSKEIISCKKFCNNQKIINTKYCNELNKELIYSCREVFNNCKTYSNKDKKEFLKCQKYFTSCNSYIKEYVKECKSYAKEYHETCENDCKIKNCSEDYNPVCGENGKTYKNLCFLNKEKIQKSSKIQQVLKYQKAVFLTRSFPFCF